MGNNSSLRNPMFDDWKPSSASPDIFINQKSGKHVRRHLVTIDEKDENMLNKRMNETHSYIAKVEYYQSLDLSKGESTRLW